MRNNYEIRNSIIPSVYNYHFQIKKQFLIVDWNQIINKIDSLIKFPRNLKIELIPRQEVSIVSHARLVR